jgi:hypothetical protein
MFDMALTKPTLAVPAFTALAAVRTVWADVLIVFVPPLFPEPHPEAALTPDTLSTNKPNPSVPAVTAFALVLVTRCAGATDLYKPDPLAPLPLSEADTIRPLGAFVEIVTPVILPADGSLVAPVPAVFA